MRGNIVGMDQPEAAPEPEPDDRRGVREAWLAQNRAAMDAWNDFVEVHGVPLAEYRGF